VVAWAAREVHANYASEEDAGMETAVIDTSIKNPRSKLRGI
jgi:hypothetical protein